MERPALKRLMADIDVGRIDCIVVYRVDRMSRSLLDFTQIMESLEWRGVSFVSATHQLNTTRSVGPLPRDMIDENEAASALAAFDPVWETLTLREQVLVALQQSRFGGDRT